MGSCCGCEGVNSAPGEGVAGADDGPDGPKRYLTNEELVNSLLDAQEPGKTKANGVQINLDVIETILLADDTAPKEYKRASERKGTGWISKDEVTSALNAVSFQGNADSSADQKATDGRVKARKGTGFVTKEKMMHLLDELSDEEQEQPSDQGGAKPPQPATTAPAPVVDAEVKARCKARKGTGFVTKSKLKKVLDAVGDPEA